MKKHRRGLRLAACLLTLAMCAALLCSCGRTGKTDDYTAAMPVIVVGSDNYPPFNYMGTDGAYKCRTYKRISSREKRRR